MTPLAQLRSEFPLLGEFTWLNAAASSPTASSVLAAMEGYLRQTAESGDLHYPAWARFRDGVRQRLARFIGATPGELAFVPSTSFGFSVIAQLLKARGQTEVLTLEGEFPSTTIPLLHAGLTLRGVRVRADGTYPLVDLEAALRPTTRAVAVSIVQYASGYRVDLPGLTALCQAKGLTLILNGAQALGQVPIDVAASGAAFFAAPSHKWFMAGYGTGLLYVRRDWLDDVPLPMAGWLSVAQNEQFQPWVHASRVDDATGFVATGTKVRREASALEVGGGPWVGFYAVDAALALHESVGQAQVLAHNIELQLTLRARLRGLGFEPTTPDDRATLSGICVVPVRGEPHDAVRALLREAKVMTTARGGGVRISTHGYNTLEDVDRLLHAIARVGLTPR